MTSPVALVTGVTSSLGKAIVRRLAFAGYKVAAADRCANSVNEITVNNKEVCRVDCFYYCTVRAIFKERELESGYTCFGRRHSAIRTKFRIKMPLLVVVLIEQRSKNSLKCEPGFLPL